MLRLLRISGILFFAVLIGFAANRMQELYETGTLFERYNSQRKADITLLATSICGIATLGFFEFARSRRRFEWRGYIPMKKEQRLAVDGPDSAGIYAAPESIDEWQGRREHISKSHRRLDMDAVNFWMGLLRIYCIVLPVVYLYTFVNYLFFWLPGGAGSLVLTIMFPVLLLGSVLTSVGLLRKKAWGMSLGYTMAIFHLLIFPVGTFAGLVMLVALVGSTSEFIVPERKRRRAARRRARAKRRKLQSTAI